MDAAKPINPDYADALAVRAERREIEQFTYADLLRARRAAIRSAEQSVGEQQRTDSTVSPHTPEPSVKEGLPECHDTPPVVRTATQAQFRRLVETIDNRGAFIDLLL